MSTVQEIYARYLVVGSVTKTAKEFHIDNKRLFSRFREAQLPLVESARKRLAARGNATGYRIGHTRYVDRSGYICILVPGHSEATTNGWAREHRVVMSDYLGRPLERWENVHHRDANKQNNAIENLELLDRVEHQGRHRRVTLSEAHRANISDAIKRHWREVRTEVMFSGER